MLPSDVWAGGPGCQDDHAQAAECPLVVHVPSPWTFEALGPSKRTQLPRKAAPGTEVRKEAEVSDFTLLQRAGITHTSRNAK